MFSATIGNILAGSVVTVSLTYVAQLKTEGSAVRFLLPTAVAPRYTPAGTAPTPAPPTASFAADASYGLDVTLHCSMMTAITSIVSPTHGHAIATALSGTTATVQLAHGTSMDQDLVVLVTPETPLVVQACLEHDSASGSHAAMLTICPQFELADKRGEYVFVVDRSGSMAGSQMRQACAALQVFLRSLPADCYFNIVGFGSRMELFERKSVRYCEQTLRSATTHVERMSANLGGTEILSPLRTVMDAAPIAGYARQVFVLTDGQVSNTDDVVAYVRSHNHHARVFSLGIGSAVSRALVEGIARAGNGTAKFAVESTRLDALVVPQLKQAMQPSIRNVKVDWGVQPQAPPHPYTPTTSSSAPMVKSLLGYRSPNVTSASTVPASVALLKQAPHTLPPVFNGERFQVYCIIEAGQAVPTSIGITAETPDGPLEARADISEETRVEGLLVHRMAARALLRDLDDATSPLHSRTGFGSRPIAHQVKQEMVTLAKRFNLASTHTSFVAVDVRSLHERLQCGGWVQHVDVPAMASQSQAAMQVLSRDSALDSVTAQINSLSQISREISECIQQQNESLDCLACNIDTGNTSLHTASLSFNRSAKRSSRGSLFDSFLGLFSRGRVDSPVTSHRLSEDAPTFSSAHADKTSSVLDLMVQQQHVDGSIPMSDALMCACGLSAETVTRTVTVSSSNAPVASTALAIAFLRLRLAHLMDAWELMADKAFAFLVSHIGRAQADSMITAFTEIL